MKSSQHEIKSQIMRLNEEFELIHDPKYQSEEIKLGLRNSLSNEALISQTQTL